MEPTNGRRFAIANQVARFLLYLSARNGDLSPAAATRRRVSELSESNAISEVQHDRLIVLLNSLCWSASDRDDRIDDLVRELARSLTIWRVEFPVKELERLEANLA